MALTVEQQHALDELMRQVPKAPTAQPAPDLLQTWLGVSGQEVKERLQALLQQKEHIETHLLGWLESNPLDATFEFLGIAAWAFYQAEKDANPKIKTYVDALYYISTCASVGYADIFAATQTGRAIAALVMAVGPALTNKTLDRPKS